MSNRKKFTLCLLCAAAALAIRLLALPLPNQYLIWSVLAIAALSPVGEECGLLPGLGLWIATSVAALMLPILESGVLFALFGFYPIMRPRIAALPKKTLRIGMRLLTFLCSSVGQFLLLCYLLRDPFQNLADGARGELFLFTLIFNAVYLMIIHFFSGLCSKFWLDTLRPRFFDE